MSGFYLQSIPPSRLEDASYRLGEIRPKDNYTYTADLWVQNSTFGNFSLQTYATKNLTLKLSYSNYPDMDVLKDQYPDGIWFSIKADLSTPNTPGGDTLSIAMSSTPTHQMIQLPVCRYVRFFVENPYDIFVKFSIFLVSI